MNKLKQGLERGREIFHILHDKYERFIPALFFSLGFLFDVFTLGEIDDGGNIIALTLYLIILLSLMGLDHIGFQLKDDAKKWQKKILEYKIDIFHFVAGALLSAFTLFYFKSGSISNSFLFLLFMGSLLVLNEVELFQKQGRLLRTSITMICLVSYLIYILPIVFGMTGTLIFYSGVILSSAISGVSLFFLNKKNLDKKQNMKDLFFPHAIVLGVFVILYSFKIFPPIPLSIKYIGIFHDIKKENGHYITSDQNPKWKFWNNGDQNFKAAPGDKVFVFTQIFAPGGFDGKVYIRWLKDTNEGYRTSDRIPLTITGGRSEGFRGYAFKSNYTEGNWQVKVETENELEIGRINFEIKKVNKPNEIKNITKR